MGKLIPSQVEQDVLLYAFRYTLGRSTHAADTLQMVIEKSWLNIDAYTRKQIQQEIIEANQKNKLGVPFIKEGWLNLLTLDSNQ